jgi:hypothetical protein
MARGDSQPLLKVSSEPDTELARSFRGLLLVRAALGYERIVVCVAAAAAVMTDAVAAVVRRQVAIGSDLRRLSVAAKIALRPEAASPSTVTTLCNLDLAVENNSIVRLVLRAVVIGVLHI